VRKSGGPFLSVATKERCIGRLSNGNDGGGGCGDRKGGIGGFLPVWQNQAIMHSDIHGGRLATMATNGMALADECSVR
jgi:hypothetical protein